jgi:acyl carrier protein
MSDVAPIRGGQAGDSSGIDVRSAVTAATGSVLEKAEVDSERSFVAQGGDSLTALVFAEKLGDQLGIDVPLELVFDADDLKDLSDQLEQRLNERTGMSDA